MGITSLRVRAKSARALALFFAYLLWPLDYFLMGMAMRRRGLPALGFSDLDRVLPFVLAVTHLRFVRSAVGSGLKRAAVEEAIADIFPECLRIGPVDPTR